MKRDDIAMGRAAREVELGSALSADELAMVSAPICFDDPAVIESLLYWQLDIARRLRSSLDRASMWNHAYQLTYERREKAVADARRHYERLRALNQPIDELLARHLQGEGITL